MKAQTNNLKLILISILVIGLSGIQIARALPSVNILGNAAVVGVGLNATTSANGAFTASGTVVFTTLADASNPCLRVNSVGVISTTTSSCGGQGFTTTSINGLATTTFTFATGTAGDALNITTSSNAITFNVPMATNLVRGLVSITSQTLAGLKTWADGIIVQTRLSIPTNTTVSNSGDISVATTSSTLKFHDGTAERAINPIVSKTITIPGPTSTIGDVTTNNITLGYYDQAFTVTKVGCLQIGTSSAATFQLNHSPTRSSSSPDTLFASGQVCSNTTTTQTYTSFNDATFAPTENLWVTFSSASSSQTSITIFGRYNP